MPFSPSKVHLLFRLHQYLRKIYRLSTSLLGIMATFARKLDGFSPVFI